MPRASVLAMFLISTIISGSMTPQVGQAIAACTLRDMEARAAVVPPILQQLARMGASDKYPQHISDEILKFLTHTRLAFCPKHSTR